MILYRAKKEQECRYCSALVLRNEIAVRVVIKRKNGTVDIKTGHAECFRKWQDEEFLRRYHDFEAGSIIRTALRKPSHHHAHVGRKKEFQNPFAAARLRGLIHYYRGKKTPEAELKATELEIRLELLRNVDFSKQGMRNVEQPL